MTGGAGTLGTATAFSPQQLIMDGEIFSWNAKIAAGIDVDEETIALDAIRRSTSAATTSASATHAGT